MVNSNGMLSFQTEIPHFFNSEFPLDYPIIAPLYSNVDTTSVGRISYLETDDAKILQTAAEKVRDFFSETNDFYPTSVFLVTWENVGYHDKGSDKVNSFQVAIISNGEDSYVEFLYPENGLQWIQGTGDGSGLPDARAQAGLIAPDGRYYLLPGSGTDRVYLLERWSNINLPGLWMFRVGIVFDENNIEVPNVNGVNNQEYIIPKSCAKSSTECHSNAKCDDYEDGFCCRCNNYYYGNGKFCVKNDVPIRVNGKVNGDVNGVQFNNLDLQCYVVMKDARTYTAISKVPRELGFSVQSLQILGATIGWIFAKPLGEALNGFQITGGVFNHTIEITSSTQTLTIRQNYLGLDVFDRLRVDVAVDGTVPILPDNSGATISEYREEYSVTAPGVIQSVSTRILKYNDSSNNNMELPLMITQSILYDYCKHTTPKVGTTWKLRVGKNFINYESREQIIRFGLSNKIGPLEDIDPCEEGRLTCTANSSCVVDGDSFKCICNPGYHEIESGDIYCVDTNECQRGQHNCDINARCINEPGTYRCECRPDYLGDGRVCTPATSCATITCPENSECLQTDTARCECLPGFTYINQACIALKAHNCYYNNNCSPFGYCAVSPENEYKCYCQQNYTGDGYECTREIEKVEYTTEDSTNVPTVREVTEIVQTTTEILHIPTTIQEIEEITEADPETVEETCILDQCLCPNGYEKIPDSIYCKRTPSIETTTIFENIEEDTCNILNNCDMHADCLFSASGIYSCACKPGYRGDGYQCELVEESCMENNICDIRASCQYDDYGRAICVCSHGYQGDGLTCTPIASCMKDEDCSENEECSYDHHSQSYECLCREGTTRDSQHQCILIGDSCGGGVCAENAECLYDYEFQTFYCACKENYTGDPIVECKPKPLGCNVLNNCGLNAACVYNTSSGNYECQCQQGYLGDGYICYRERDCHIDPYMCDVNARCVTNAVRRYVCECRPGYVGNGTFCNEIPKYGGNFLLLNQGMATVKIPFEIDKRNRPRPIQVQMQQVAVGLDVDCLEGKVYWGDVFRKVIKSSTYNGTEKKDFINNGVGSPEGLSIDWVSRNIYWTDSTNRTIEVANIDTRLTRTLIDTNLENPRGIAVHPQRGKIFWTDWERKDPKIEWSNSDGSDRQVFLNGSVVSLPNSLAIDFDNEQLCYADAGTKVIECVEIDTKIRRVIATNCSYPFGITVTRERVYWSDWDTKKIEQVDKATLTRLKPLSIPMGGVSTKLYEVVAVPERCPNLINVCQYHKEQCPENHICLPDGKGSRRCLCGRSIDAPAETSTCNDVV